MRDHERVEASHAGLRQPPQDRAAGRPGVDQHGDAVRLEQRRVALTDVEERDHELAAGGWLDGPAVERRDEGERRRRHRHEDGDGTTTARDGSARK